MNFWTSFSFFSFLNRLRWLELQKDKTRYVDCNTKIKIKKKGQLGNSLASKFKALCLEAGKFSNSINNSYMLLESISYWLRNVKCFQIFFVLPVDKICKHEHTTKLLCFQHSSLICHFLEYTSSENWYE